MFLRRTLLASVSTTAIAVMALTQMAQADEPMPVVATFSILGDMVERIGGEHISLTTLVGPDGDAHVYQPTPKDARSVSEAEVMFINGLEFEGWLERLAEAASFDGTLVTATKGIDAIAFDDHKDHDDHDDHKDHKDHDDHDDHKDHDDHDDHDDHKDHDDHDEHKDHDDHDDHKDHDDHDEHDDHKDHDDHDEHKDHDDHDDHHGHNHGAFDPHAWQSLDHAVTYVDNITAALATADPENAADYYSNRADYIAQIESLSKELAVMMSSIPENKRTVVTPHDAFGYFSQTYDINFVAPQGLSTDSEISASDVAELIEQIREEGISAVFIESITDNRMIEQIANETGAVVGGTLYSDALSEKDGPASTYLKMFRHNAVTISSVLSK